MVLKTCLKEDWLPRMLRFIVAYLFVCYGSQDANNRPEMLPSPSRISTHGHDELTSHFEAHYHDSSLR